MSALIALVIVLAGVNLTRLSDRDWPVALITALTAGLCALLGWLDADAWWRLAAVALIAGLTVLLWHQWRRAHPLAGFAVLVAGCAAPFVLVSEPWSSRGPWLLLAGALLLADPATRLLRWGMGLVGKPVTGLPDSLGRGEAIGVLERWLTLVVVLRGDYAALGFIMAAKALARHKRFEEAGFAEYFLVGTLASVLMAVVVGETMRGFGILPGLGLLP